MKPEISAITLAVTDMDRARSFYATGLGWPIAQDFGHWVSFDLGGVGFGLFDRAALAADGGVAAEGTGFDGVVLSHIVADRTDVDAAIAAAEQAGATVLKPAEDAQWGGRSGTFADPDGHVWKIAAN